MCYTKYASLRSFIIGSLTSLVLYAYTNDRSLKAIALFILFVSFMQMFDYIFWLYPVEIDENESTTRLAMIFNHLQPIVLFFLLYFFVTKSIIKDTISQLLISSFTVYSIIYSVYCWKNIKYTLPKNDVLYWEWNNLPYAQPFYALFLLCFLYFGGEFLRYPINISFVFFALSSFIFSFYKYKHNSNVGRFWCHYTGYTPLLFLLIDTMSM